MWATTTPTGYSDQGTVVGFEVPEADAETKWFGVGQAVVHRDIKPEEIVWVDRDGYSEVSGGNRMSFEANSQYSKTYHEEYVKQALAAGKPVPEAVLEEYGLTVQKGDFVGHPFRGNQWTSGAKKVTLDEAARSEQEYYRRKIREYDDFEAYKKDLQDRGYDEAAYWLDQDGKLITEEPEHGGMAYHTHIAATMLLAGDERIKGADKKLAYYIQDHADMIAGMENHRMEAAGFAGGMIKVRVSGLGSGLRHQYAAVDVEKIDQKSMRRIQNLILDGKIPYVESYQILGEDKSVAVAGLSQTDLMIGKRLVPVDSFGGTTSMEWKEAKDKTCNIWLKGERL